MNRLFEVRAEVDATGGASAYYAAATVYALAGAATENEAKEMLRRDLVADGYVLVSPQIQVREVPVGDWAEYVEANWQGLKGQLPDDARLQEALKAVFLLHVSFYPHD